MLVISVLFNFNLGNFLRRLRISWFGLTLSIIYLIWAFLLLSWAMEDGLTCGNSGGSIISICGDDLLFVAATLPFNLLANLIGFEPDYRSLVQWMIYIGLCLVLVYILGFWIEKVVEFIMKKR